MKYYLLIFLLSIMLAGCSQNTESKTEVKVTSTATDKIEKPNKKKQTQETPMPVSKLDIENYNLDYKKKTDDQSFFSWNCVAKTENGYYLWGKGVEYFNYLMFFDLKTQKTVPVCNLPNCNHLDNSCNAYYPLGESDMGFICKSGLWYYEDYIYMIGYDAEDYLSLYRTKLDGSSREKYMQLYRADTTSQGVIGSGESKQYTTPEVMIHRGYVYYINREEKNPKLRRIKLGGKQTEILYETNNIVYKTDGDKTELSYVRGYGDFVFFQRTSVFEEEYRELEGLYAYNTQTAEITFVSNSINRDFDIFENEIYYSTGEELCKFSIQTQKEEKIMDYPQGITNFSVDANYITIHSSKDEKIRIYDRKLNLIYEYNEEANIDENYKGDENFLFAQFEGEKGRIRRLDKSKLKDNKAKWEVMY